MKAEQRHGATTMQHRGCVMRILAPLMMGSTLMELGTNYTFMVREGPRSDICFV